MRKAKRSRLWSGVVAMRGGSTDTFAIDKIYERKCARLSKDLYFIRL